MIKKKFIYKISAITLCVILAVLTAFLPAVNCLADGTNENTSEYSNDNSENASNGSGEQLHLLSPTYINDHGIITEENTETLCNWGGVSSFFVWISLMQQKEQGNVDFDTPVSTYLPDDFMLQAGIKEDFTILDLMNHTAGFQQNQAGHVLLSGEKFTSLEEWLIQNKTSQVYHPGDYMAYSDYGITLAAYILENVTGVAYYDYVKSNILDPLGMEKTSIYYDYSDCEYVKSNTAEGDTVLYGFYPAYSVRATVSDLVILMDALTSDDERILSKESKEEFFTPTLKYRDASKMGDARCAHGLAYYYPFEKPVCGIFYSDMNATGAVYISEDLQSYAVLCAPGASKLEDDQKYALNQIFGERGVIEGGFHNNLSDLAGSYIKADTVVKGTYSFTSIFTVYTLKALNERQLALSGRPNEVYMTQISNTMFQTADTEVGHYFATIDGQKILEFPYFDMISYPKWLQTLKVILIIVYFIGFFYSNLVLLIALFTLIYRLIKKEDAGKIPKFRKYHYIQCGVYTFHGIIFQMMAFSYMMGINGGIANTAKLMYYIGAIMGFVYWMFFVRTGMKEECAAREKTLYWITAVCAVLQIVFSAVFGLILSK